MAEVLFHYLMRFLPAGFVGGWVILSTARRIGIGVASRSWPSVTGVIKQVRRAPAWAPIWWLRYYQWKGITITYAYAVNGIAFESNLVGFHGQLDQHGEAGRPTRSLYTIGQRVHVYYNPRRPQQAILQPGMGIRDAIILVIAIAAVSTWLVWAMSGDVP